MPTAAACAIARRSTGSGRSPIPPAWTDVWICPDPLGHLQATGRDARGRKQYRYHPRYRQRRETAKYERLVAFARALPAIRRQVDRDLARPGLPREKVLAAVVRLLELTLIRVGNEEYRKLNRSFGLTTLRDRHATVRGSSIRFRFKGKSGRDHEVGLRDRRLATVVRRCQDLPGQELFQYVGEDGEPVDIASDDVNDYLRAIAPDVTAKDFRTWAGTVLAYRALRALDEPATATRGQAERRRRDPRHRGPARQHRGRLPPGRTFIRSSSRRISTRGYGRPCLARPRRPAHRPPARHRRRSVPWSGCWSGGSGETPRGWAPDAGAPVVSPRRPARDRAEGRTRAPRRRPRVAPPRHGRPSPRRSAA